MTEVVSSGGAAVYESLLDAVGHTPLVRLARLGAGLSAAVNLRYGANMFSRRRHIDLQRVAACLCRS